MLAWRAVEVLRNSFQKLIIRIIEVMQELKLTIASDDLI